MKKKVNSKITMLDHSLAKVELFQRYWSIYLNILNRVDFITKIHLYDLFAGEGMYDNDGKGSPIVAVETIKEIYYQNGKSCKDMDVVFNDNGESEIEVGILKISRVKSFIDKMFVPKNVSITYKQDDFSTIIKETIRKLNDLRSTDRALLFIDPWGYKEINISDIQSLLQNKKSELILFLPISFMYRFANKALNEDEFPGGKPLKKFLESIFEGEIPNLNDIFKFIDSVKKKFKSMVPVKYVDTFTIQRDNCNHFSLFFFTENETGFEKMLETKWKMDEEHGNGFRLEDKNQTKLFGGAYFSNYPDDLEKLLTEKGSQTNQELKSYGLDNGFLPRHTNEILVNLEKKNKIEVKSLDGQKAQGFYIGNKKRLIEIRLKK